MNRRMPRPEDVSRHHIDATIMAFLNGEKDADWTEVALVTLHPREEIKIVLKESLEDTEPSTTHGFVNSSCRSSPKESRCEELGIYLATTSSRQVAG